MSAPTKPKTYPNYLRVADPYPLQMPEWNALAPFYAALAEGRLTTTQCVKCEVVHFPPRIGFCPACASGEDARWIELPSEGRVVGFSIQEAGVPLGFQPPLIFAVVEVGPVRLFTTLIGEPSSVEIGSTVRLQPSRIADNPDGSPRYLPTFGVSN